MKKILLCLLVFTLSPNITAQDMKTVYEYTIVGDEEGYEDEPTVMAETCTNVLMRWNEGINRHDAAEVASCFSKVAFYYSDCYEYSGIERSLNSVFKKNPLYQQALSDITVTIINSTQVKITFNKQVKTTPDTSVKTYPAYLNINYLGEGDAVIKKESDEVTDANLERKQRKIVQIDNKTLLRNIFCPANAGKYIETSYWDLVGFEEDSEEGPLAEAMINATGFARCSMFGTLHKSYQGKPGTFYVGGSCAAGEADWYVIYVYDISDNTLRAINCD